MQDLKFRAEILEESSQGLILCIGFEGLYPPGSDGNEHARRMEEYVRKVVVQRQPDAVLLDMTALDYVWGDAMGGVLYAPLAEHAPEFRTVIPACVVATGTTAKALEWFFEDPTGFRAFGMQMFDSIHDGIAFLRRRLAESTA
jgi:hypothetical protein